MKAIRVTFEVGAVLIEGRMPNVMVMVGVGTGLWLAYIHEHHCYNYLHQILVYFFVNPHIVIS